TRDKRRKLLFRWASAISFIGIIALSLYYWLHSRKDKDQYHIITTTGSIRQLVLPDSTRVWLNTGSSLKYHVDTPRQVGLIGEAYFEVRPDNQRPFIVLLPDEAKVKTHGAKFNIYAYTNDPGFLTSLVEGSAEMDAGTIEKLSLN